jgi:hypothetical protein
MLKYARGNIAANLFRSGYENKNLKWKAQEHYSWRIKAAILNDMFSGLALNS